jgi:hypothetical protein
MKLVNVLQGVRAREAQVPPEQRLARSSVGISACNPRKGSTEPEGARLQAV